MTSGSRITCTSDDAVPQPLEPDGRGLSVSVVRLASLHLLEVYAGTRPSAASAMLRQASHRRRASRGRLPEPRLTPWNGLGSLQRKNLEAHQKFALAHPVAGARGPAPARVTIAADLHRHGAASSDKFLVPPRFVPLTPARTL